MEKFQACGPFPHFHVCYLRMFAMFVCCVVLYPPSPISTRVTRTTQRIKKSLHTIQTIDWTNSSQCFLCLLSNCQRFLGCLEWFSCGVKTSHGRHLVTWHPQPVPVVAWVNISSINSFISNYRLWYIYPKLVAKSHLSQLVYQLWIDIKILNFLKYSTNNAYFSVPLWWI